MNAFVECFKKEVVVPWAAYNNNNPQYPIFIQISASKLTSMRYEDKYVSFGWIKIKANINSLDWKDSQNLKIYRLLDSKTERYPWVSRRSPPT